MANTRCNYCGQVVSFIDIRGNSTCPICRQSSTSCCEGGSCNVSAKEQIHEQTPQGVHEQNTTMNREVYQIHEPSC